MAIPIMSPLLWFMIGATEYFWEWRPTLHGLSVLLDTHALSLRAVGNTYQAKSRSVLQLLLILTLSLHDLKVSEFITGRALGIASEQPPHCPDFDKPWHAKIENVIVCTRWAGSSKTFNNSGMELLKHLKFGTIVVLFYLLKIPFNYHRSHKSTNAVTSFSWTFRIAKLHRSILYPITGIINHQIGWSNILLQKKKSIFSFSQFLRIQLNVYIL